MSQSTLILPIEGMSCAACANRLEKVLNKLPGVKAEVSFASESARVELEEGVAGPEIVSQAVSHAGFAIRSETLQLDLEGMSCAACASRIEKVLNRLPGVEAV